jgi:hypothetical protein
VDIIWVMDESGSMSPERAAIAADANKFFAQAVHLGINFRMGVTNVCDPKGSYSDAVGKFCSVASTNRYHDGGADRFLLPIELATFSSCILNPPGYEGIDEYGLVNAKEAVERHLPREDNNSAKIRPGAQVVIIVVTDEIPNSLNSIISYTDYQTCVLETAIQTKLDAALEPYYKYFAGKPSPQSKVDHFYTIAGACTTSLACTNADVAHGYKEVSKTFNGKLYDICQSDLGSAISDILNNILLSTSSTITMSHVPIPASLNVALQGMTMPRSMVKGFLHIPMTNKLSFQGFLVKKGDVIVASYNVWK